MVFNVNYLCVCIKVLHASTVVGKVKMTDLRKWKIKYKLNRNHYHYVRLNLNLESCSLCSNVNQSSVKTIAEESSYNSFSIILPLVFYLILNCLCLHYPTPYPRIDEGPDGIAFSPIGAFASI